MKWSISLLTCGLLVAYACRHPYTQGERLYKTYCVNCHMEDGSGLALLIPPLAGADYLATQSASVPCVIRYGSKGGNVVNGELFTEPMPSFLNLNEVELSNLINYINRSWGNRVPETSPARVLQYLENCPVQ